MTNAEMVLVCKTLALCVHQAGTKGIPSGHLYALAMNSCSLAEFQTCLDAIKETGLVTESSHLLTWVKS